MTTERVQTETELARDLAAAQARAERDMAVQRAERADGELRGARARLATVEKQMRAEIAEIAGRRRTELETIARRVAQLYGREQALAALNECEGGPRFEWCSFHEAEFGEHDHEFVEPERLMDFITSTLDLDHPAVRFPQPGPATIANACVIARTELARHGGTLDKVAEAILRMAAEPQRVD